MNKPAHSPCHKAILLVKWSHTEVKPTLQKVWEKLFFNKPLWLFMFQSEGDNNITKGHHVQSSSLFACLHTSCFETFVPVDSLAQISMFFGFLFPKCHSMSFHTHHISQKRSGICLGIVCNNNNNSNRNATGNNQHSYIKDISLLHYILRFVFVF